MTTPLESDSSLRVKIGYLETRNAYEHYDLTSQVEVLQQQVERLESELEDRPVVWAIQHIETKTLSNRGYSVDLYASVEAAESAIRTEFEPSEHQAVIFTGRHCNDTD